MWAPTIANKEYYVSVPKGVGLIPATGHMPHVKIDL